MAGVGFRRTLFTTPQAAMMRVFHFNVRSEVLVVGAVFNVQQHTPYKIGGETAEARDDHQRGQALQRPKCF